MHRPVPLFENRLSKKLGEMALFRQTEPEANAYLSIISPIESTPEYLSAGRSFRDQIHRARAHCIRMRLLHIGPVGMKSPAVLSPKSSVERVSRSSRGGCRRGCHGNRRKRRIYISCFRTSSTDDGCFRCRFRAWGVAW